MTTSTARILVVDDEAPVRQSVVRALTVLGHTVEQASDGASALRMSAYQTYDMAIVDYDMPGGTDGLAVISLLRELQPDCMRILMTARGDFPMVVRAVNQGEVTRVLAKPFPIAALEEAVKAALDAVRRQTAAAASRRELVAMAAMLDECIEKRLIKLALQPIVDAQSAVARNMPVAAECLLRCDHPVLNGPMALLKAAERTDRTMAVGALVNQLAAERMVSLPEPFLLFVNVHTAQLGDPELMKSFGPLVPWARRIVLEITERASLHEVEHWETAIAVLGEAGFHFAIDDLGSGHNGLSLLADLQPTYIKADMSIVRNVNVEPRKQRLIGLLAEFASATGAKLVAEGVETAEEAAALIECRADLLQGYYFGRPAIDWTPTPVARAS